MPQTLTLTITLLALSRLLSQPAQAETLSVCLEGGCDFTSIQSAIDGGKQPDGEAGGVACSRFSFPRPRTRFRPAVLDLLRAGGVLRHGQVTCR